MIRTIHLPIDERSARDLRAGDVFEVTGRIFTARDEAHQLMATAHRRGEPLPFDASAMALFHCGPLVRPGDRGWRVIAAGPTTSIRMEPYEDIILHAFSPRIIIGKGGMGERTQDALEDVGAAYVQYTGGAAAIAARQVARVEDVFWLDKLGTVEAVWILCVERFGPLLVTMDSHGGSLHRELATRTAQRVAAIVRDIEAGTGEEQGPMT